MMLITLDIGRNVSFGNTEKNVHLLNQIDRVKLIIKVEAALVNIYRLTGVGIVDYMPVLSTKLFFRLRNKCCLVQPLCVFSKSVRIFLNKFGITKENSQCKSIFPV